MTKEERLAELAEVFAEYHPCATGVHVCGQTPDEERPLTVANFPIWPLSAARRFFERAKAAFAIPHPDSDLVVDLMSGEDIVEDFSMRRQDLAALERLAGAPSQ